MSKRIIVLGIIVGIVLIALILKGLFSKPSSQLTTVKPNPPVSSTRPDEPPKIVSTKPDPLEDNIISATDIVEITFNRPLENVGEFKSRIEPKIDYKVELSGDRKTAKIMPAKPYQLGATYTLFINPDTKFDGVGEWRQDKTFRFRTITYRGV